MTAAESPIRGFSALRKLPRVLVVHRDPAVVRWIREAFIASRHSALIEQAPTAKRAYWHLDWYHGRRGCWLVVIGLDMSQEGGFDLLSRLRADSRLMQIPVIVLMQRLNQAEERRAIASGADFVF